MVKPVSSSNISRRDFLRLLTALGGAAAMSTFLEACARIGLSGEQPSAPTGAPSAPAPATGTPAPTRGPTPASPAPTEALPSATPTTVPTEAAKNGAARVAFVKTDRRAEGVRRAIDLLGINSVENKRVFLKPNFNSADPAPGSTHPDVLLALVTALKEMGAAGITVGDRSGMGATRRVMEGAGVFRLAQETGFEAIVFDELPEDEWMMVQPPGSHWQYGFPIARACVEAEAVVQTCCLKTHQYGGHFTLSLKNSVGLVAKRHPQYDHDFMNELHSSPDQRRMIAEINAAYAPALVVMDGVEAFISGGPHAGELAAPRVILAGTDRVALDAVGVALLRYHGCQTEAARGKIFEQEQIARAVELGLGVDGPEMIEFVTGDADSAAYAEEIRAVLMAG